MADVQTCVTCGKNAPETETNYTLISAQFGWRLTRYKRPDGTLVLEWRCPNCWREFKRTRPAGTSSPPASGDGRPSSGGLPGARASTIPPPSDAPPSQTTTRRPGPGGRLPR